MTFKFLRWRRKKAAKLKSALRESMAAANQRDEKYVISTTESAIATTDWIPQIPRRNDLSNPDPILRNRTVDTRSYRRGKGDFRSLDYTLDDDIETKKTQPSFADTWTSFINEGASIAINPSASSVSSDTSSIDFTIDDADDSSTLSGSTLIGSDIFTYDGSYDDNNPDIFDDHEVVSDLFQLRYCNYFLSEVHECREELSYVLSG